MVVTPRFILCHDLRVLAKALLSLVGALVIWFLQSLFLWAVTSIFLGWDELSPRVLLVCAGVPTYFLIRSLCKMNLSKRSWRESLPDYESDPGLSGLRLMARGVDLTDGVGESAFSLITSAAPRMVRTTIDEMNHLIPPTGKESAVLERVRENLAARDSWEFLRDFKAREPEIRKLAALGLVSVREISGIWSIRISLKGQRA